MIIIVAGLGILCALAGGAMVWAGVSAGNQAPVVNGLFFLVPGLLLAVGAPLASWRAESGRQALIKGKEGEWSAEVRQEILGKRVALNMTPEMVRTSWGTPTAVDERETTDAGVRERWVYSRGPRYIWFTDGKVSKIKL